MHALLFLHTAALFFAVAAEQPSAQQFLAPYVNPEEHKLPEDGIYPLGRRMPLGAYSSNINQLRRMSAAGFTMDGPHYAGQTGPPRWEAAEAAGMKGWFRLRISDYRGQSGWGAVLPQMNTLEGRANLKKQIENMINYVQANPKLNNHIAAWYGYPEEPIARPNTPIEQQRAYLKLVHEVIVATDRKRRPFYVSERGDSSRENMIANACFQDGCLKQNYLIESNPYSGDDEALLTQWQWARDQVIACQTADRTCPSYTGRPRAAISTLAMFRDPKDKSRRNERWLRKIITYDVYVQLAAGIDGLLLYTWTRSSAYWQTTKALQENIYLDVLGRIARSGLGRVFLWGAEREDITLEVLEGPREVRWRKYRRWFTAPAVFLRNIQYGPCRYILLVNNSKKSVRVKLSPFPRGLRVEEMLSGKTFDLGPELSPAVEPLGVRMYKIARAEQNPQRVAAARLGAGPFPWGALARVLVDRLFLPVCRAG